jgi:hypothetical protein
VIRALAIVLVVVSHTGLTYLPGGAHALLVVAGYNSGRFHFAPGTPRQQRFARAWRSVRTFALPSVLWIGSVTLIMGWYPWSTPLLVNQFMGGGAWDEQRWNFWFVESLAWLLLIVGGAMSVPALDTAYRRWPWPVAACFVALGLLTLFTVPQPAEFAPSKFVLSAVLWLFALGWAVRLADRRWQRVVMSAVVVAVVPTMWVQEWRHIVIVVALALVLIWLPSIRVPRLVVPGIVVVASASLYVYLTHYAVLRIFKEHWPWLALALSFPVGIAYQWVYQRTRKTISRGGRARETREPRAS